MSETDEKGIIKDGYEKHHKGRLIEIDVCCERKTKVDHKSEDQGRGEKE